MYLHVLTAVLSCWPVHSFPHRAVQDYYSVIVIIWHTWAETFFFLFLQHLCPVSLCHIRALSLYSTPPNPLCCSTVWWQGASLLGRWDSNQSGLPRGPSDRRARLPNCPQAGRQAGRLSRCNTCSQRDRCRCTSWPPQCVNHFLGQMEDLTTQAIWAGQWI